MTLHFNYRQSASEWRSSAPVVSRWLWPGNRTFLEVDSLVVSWWIVAFFAQCVYLLTIMKYTIRSTIPVSVSMLSKTYSLALSTGTWISYAEPFVLRRMKQGQRHFEGSEYSFIHHTLHKVQMENNKWHVFFLLRQSTASALIVFHLWGGGWLGWNWGCGWLGWNMFSFLNYSLVSFLKKRYLSLYHNCLILWYSVWYVASLKLVHAKHTL